MLTAMVSLLVAFFSAIPAILNIVDGRRAATHAKQKGLADVEADELDAGMDRLDRGGVPKP